MDMYIEAVTQLCLAPRHPLLANNHFAGNCIPWWRLVSLASFPFSFLVFFFFFLFTCIWLSLHFTCTTASDYKFLGSVGERLPFNCFLFASNFSLLAKQHFVSSSFHLLLLLLLLCQVVTVCLLHVKCLWVRGDANKLLSLTLKTGRELKKSRLFKRVV